MGENTRANMASGGAPNSLLNSNQKSGRELIVEDKVRKVCGDGSYREIKFSQTNSCFDTTEPTDPRVRPGGHHLTYVESTNLPKLHTGTGELIRTSALPNPELFLRGHSGSGGMVSSLNPQTVNLSEGIKPPKAGAFTKRPTQHRVQEVLREGRSSNCHYALCLRQHDIVEGRASAVGLPSLPAHLL